ARSPSWVERSRALAPHGVRVPNGFAITADAYRRTLERAGALPRLQEVLAGLNVEDLARRARHAREAMYAAPRPDELASEIRAAYARLLVECSADTTVA